MGKIKREKSWKGKEWEKEKGKQQWVLYWNNLQFRTVTFSYFLICFPICSKVTDAKRDPSYAMLESYQSIEEKANKISFMLIFRGKPDWTTESWGKKKK